VAQRGQDLRGDFDRALDAGNGFDLHHARAVLERIRHVLGVGDVLQAAAHEALDRDDGVLGIGGLVGLRLVADVGVAVGQIAHDRRQQWTAVFIAQYFRDAAADRGHERVGGAQVDTDRQPVLVRGRGHARF
jgi:hypothetical protein